jgi:hypothetical protein
MGNLDVDSSDELNRAHSGLLKSIDRADTLAQSLRDLSLHPFADSARDLGALLRAAAEFADVRDAERLTTAERLSSCAARLAGNLSEDLEDGAPFVPSIEEVKGGQQ